MSNATEAQAALVDHRKIIDGREAICNLASKPQGQKTSTEAAKSKRDGSSSFRSDHRGSPHSTSRSKRGDSAQSSSDRYSRNAQPAPSAYAYPPTATQYAYDYGNYQYPAAAAAANAVAMNPYSAVNPYANAQYNAAMNPYAQYNRAATAFAATPQNVTQQQQNTNNANANAANIGPQPYVPSAAQYQPGFGAVPYRFN